MHSLEEKAEAAARKYKMLDNAAVVYVGFSGGADSTALLLALNALKGRFGYTLRAVHINHNIRGEESDRDQRFCEDLCRKLGIDVDVRQVDAVGFSRDNRLSLEEGARKLRYDIFESLDGVTALAHNLNDSAETVLFNLARGTGIKGLCGIPPVRGRIVRPLIECTREDIERYLADMGQGFVTDSTNLSDDYTRNKIRHNIIPLMEDIHGGFCGNILRMTENLRADCEYLDMQAEIEADNDMRGMHPALRRRIIMNILRKNMLEPSDMRIKSLEEIALSGGKINLSGDIFAVAENGRIYIKKLPKGRIIFKDTPVKIGENDFLCDKKVIIGENNCENALYNDIVHKKSTNDCMDCDKIQGSVLLRNRRDGDSFIRANRGFTSSLKKLMNEKYAADKRDFIPILADENGIIWVEGFGVADRVKIDENTKRILTVKVGRSL
ncbi:MAG: tRNA lysidine(34) synthetase TilS [Oscillospiraceae bacterium]